MKSCRSTTIRDRFPRCASADDAVGLLEPRAGILFPERCVGVHLRFAAAHGATLRTNDPVTAWSADVSGVGVIVETASGGSYSAERLVISAGGVGECAAAGAVDSVDD